MKSKFPRTIFGIDLKPKIIEFSSPIGEVEALNFVEQYFILVQVIYLDTQYIDQTFEVSENMSRTLSAAKFYNIFYMSSFLIYMLASLQLRLGLLRLEFFSHDVKSYEFLE